MPLIHSTLAMSLLLPLVLAAGTGCTVSSRASGEGLPVDISLNPYLGRLVTVTVDIGGDSARLIFDTGGGETVISPAIAERLGCVPSGRSVGFRMSGERVDFARCSEVTVLVGGVPFLHDLIGVWDVQAVLPDGVPSVDGILSLKTLASTKFSLRLAEQRLTLETEASFAQTIEGMQRLRSRIATGSDGDELTVFVRGVAADTGWFLVDSGNLDRVLLGRHAGGTTAGTPETWEGELRLEGTTGIPAEFRRADIIYDGVLSERFLRQWTLAFDLDAGAVWASPGS